MKTYQEGWFGGRAIEALRGVTLETNPGEVFGLLGPNGAGKTTLIKILLGVVRSSGGTAKIFGHRAGSVAARRRVGYLPESLRIDRHHTARSALDYYGQMSGLGRSEIALRVGPLLELVGLSGRDRESVRRFSKGMYQRLGLAQALLHDPELLILDEPTDGLDPVGRSEVRRLLSELKQRGITIFLNSHILQEVEMICDRVAVLAAGKVRGIGSIGDLTRRLGGGQAVIEAMPPAGHSIDWKRTLGESGGLTNQHGSLDVIGLPDGGVRVTLATDSQMAVDLAIDQLRSAQCSITSVHSGRRSLEDVFLSLVGPDGDALAEGSVT